jgi:hypothetical protein
LKSNKKKVKQKDSSSNTARVDKHKMWLIGIIVFVVLIIGFFIFYGARDALFGQVISTGNIIVENQPLKSGPVILGDQVYSTIFTYQRVDYVLYSVAGQDSICACLGSSCPTALECIQYAPAIPAEVITVS